MGKELRRSLMSEINTATLSECPHLTMWLLTTLQRTRGLSNKEQTALLNISSTLVSNKFQTVHKVTSLLKSKKQGLLIPWGCRPFHFQKTRFWLDSRTLQTSPTLQILPKQLTWAKLLFLCSTPLIRTKSLKMWLQKSRRWLWQEICSFRTCGIKKFNGKLKMTKLLEDNRNIQTKLKILCNLLNSKNNRSDSSWLISLTSTLAAKFSS